MQMLARYGRVNRTDIPRFIFTSPFCFTWKKKQFSVKEGRELPEEHTRLIREQDEGRRT